MAPPGHVRCPAVQPRRERQPSARVGIVAKLCGKSPKHDKLHGSSGNDPLRGGQLCIQLLLPCQITLLRKLLALKKTLLGL
jgi:hypothetical protein